MPTYTTNYNLSKPNVNSADDEDLWGSQLNDNFDTIDQQIKANADAITNFSAAPTGVIWEYAGSTAPSGYLLCYGQAVSRTTYADLFLVIGTTYGSGDGSTTFNLPDRRGRVAAGKDNMGGTSANRLTNQSGGVDGDTLGATGGSETHTLTTSQIPSHSHTMGTGIHDEDAAGSAITSPSISGGTGSAASTSSTGGGQAHNNVQPTFITNIIIKT